MDIRYTILGFVNWKPFSGYALKKMIAYSDLFYWSGNNNQIYTALIQLNKEGLVEQEIEFQENLPAKKVYSITEQGRQEFKRWQVSNPELPEIQHNFMIQLAWTGELSDEQLDELLGRYAAEIEVQMKMAEEKAARASDRPERNPRERYLWRKIDDHLAGFYRNELEWIHDLRDQLASKSYN